VLDKDEMEDALSNGEGESADKQLEAPRASEVSQIDALLRNSRFGNSESMEGAQGPNAANPQPQPGIQNVHVVLP
jgi:predicted RNA-binding protein associated with RNAse of E/G family